MSEVKPGIYKITNLINNKIYIGSAYNLSNRFSTHKYCLKNQKHKNPHLQSAWNFYGENAFDFQIIEIINDLSIILKREQYYIDFYNSTNKNIGYNIAKRAGNTAGIIPSIETRKKQSEARKGKIPSNKGKIFTDEEKKKRREKFKNNIASWSKIDWTKVTEIRSLYNQEKWTQKQIGEKFGLFQTTISEIIRNAIWKDENYSYVERKKNK